MDFQRFYQHNLNLFRNTFKNKSVYLNINTKNMENNSINQGSKLITENISDNIVECKICRGSEPLENMHIMTQCKHCICYECLKLYLVNLLKDSVMGRFECPSCEETIHPDDVKQMIKMEQHKNPNYMEASNEFYVYHDFLKKFNDLYLKSTLNKIDGLIWCPGIDCQYCVITNDSSKCPKAKCQSFRCGIEFCTNCRTPWHPSLRCSENLKIRKELDEIKLPTDSDEVFKICPGCKIMIGRINDGKCNHMKCPFCSTNFCWLCLRKADQFHFINGAGCSMFGKHKPNKVKKIVVPLVSMLGAPVIVAMIAIGATAYLLFYVPYTVVAKKNKDRLKKKNKKYPFWKSFFLWCGTGILTTVASIGLIAIGIPVSLIYFYIMYPKSIISDLLNSRSRG